MSIQIVSEVHDEASDGQVSSTNVVALPSHHWLRDWAHHFREQCVALVAITNAMFRQPATFASAWANKEQHLALNPLAYFAMAIGATSPIVLLVQHFAHRSTSGEHGLVGTLLHFEPYFQFIGLGLLCHAVLKLLGQTKPWHLTLGVSLFAGGPAACADMLSAVVSSILSVVAEGAQTTLTIEIAEIAAATSIVAVNGVFVIALVSALTGVHRMPWWKPLGAWGVAQLVWTASKIAVFLMVLHD